MMLETILRKSEYKNECLSLQKLLKIKKLRDKSVWMFTISYTQLTLPEPEPNLIQKQISAFKRNTHMTLISEWRMSF